MSSLVNKSTLLGQGGSQVITKEQVFEALKAVEDPEIRRPVTELDMVKDIDIQDGHVRVVIALTVKGCPLQQHFHQEVRRVVGQLEGVTSVEVDLTVMSDQERAQLVEKLRGSNTQQAQSPILAGTADTEVIAIASGKGGVGKSTVTVNLAVALAARGYQVGIIDSDMYGSSIPQMMGIDRLPVRIDRVIMPVEKHGVKVISMGFFVPENKPVIWRGPMLGKALQQFFNDVHWGDLDFLLLDLPPGTGDIALDVHRLLPAAKEIIVTTPQSTATHVAYRAGKMAIDTGHKIIGVVENMSYFRSAVSQQKEYVFGQGGGSQLAEILEVPLLGQIPLGNPTEEDADIYLKDTEAWKVFQAIADAVIEQADRIKVYK